MSPLSQYESDHYLGALYDAHAIVMKWDLALSKKAQPSRDAYFSLVEAVFEKIAPNLFYLRQEQPLDARIASERAFLKQEPKKPSRIYGETPETHWQPKTTSWGEEQEWSRDDYLRSEDDLGILEKIIREKAGQPDAKYEVTHQGYVYWANQSKDGSHWYLNRRLKK